MKLGLCTQPENSRLAAQLGYDYIECSLNAIAALDEAAFSALAAQADTLPAPIQKCNCFLPAAVRVTGPEVSRQTQIAYLEKAFSRARALGTDLVVFGSGGARQVPDGYPFDQAWRQMADFLRLVAPYAEQYGITLVLEPLRRQECNLLNLVSEATLLAALIDSPRVAVLADTYHMICGQEPLAAMVQAGKALRHVHISHALSDLSGRVFPAPQDGENYAPLFSALQAMGYAGDVSIEASARNLAQDAASAFACLSPLVQAF